MHYMSFLSSLVSRLGTGKYTSGPAFKKSYLPFLFYHRWADVPIKKHNNIFLSSCQHGPPSVKYRGVFLNDEQPA